MIKKYLNYITLEKIINYLLNNNYFYLLLTITSLLFSYFINLNIGSYFIGFIVSFWIIIKNNNYNLLKIILTIFIIVLLYYFTGIIYCEGGDTDVNTNNNSNISETENTKAVILESKDHYHITKEDFNKGVDLINQSVKLGIESVAPNLGAGTAAAGAAGSVIKNSKLPVLPKLALAGLSAAVVGGSTRIGLVTADALIKSDVSKESITPSRENILNTGDEIQSPVNDFINSMLEKGDMLSPLEQLLRCQLGLNVLMLTKIFILIMIIYNKLFISSGFSIFSKLFNLPIWPSSFKLIINRFNSLFYKMSHFNNRFFYILFIIISLALIFDIFLSIYIIGELNTNLQEYIDLYNNIKK